MRSKLKLYLSVALCCGAVAACGKKDEKKKPSANEEKRTDESGQPVADSNKRGGPRITPPPSSGENVIAPSTLAGTWRLRLNNDSKILWQFSENEASKTNLCQKSGEDYSATVRVAASFDGDKLKVTESKRASASTSDGMLGCASAIDAGEYAYELSEDKNILTLDYGSVVWTFDRIIGAENLKGVFSMLVSSNERAQSFAFSADKISRTLVCKNNSNEDVEVSVEAPASISAGTISVKSSKSSSAFIGGETCQIGISAGDYNYSLLHAGQVLSLDYKGEELQFLRQ